MSWKKVQAVLLLLRVRLAQTLLAGTGLEVSGDALDLRRRIARALVFMYHSGFLRDGRYPGGRAAERKLRRILGSGSIYNVRLRVWKRPETD